MAKSKTKSSVFYNCFLRLFGNEGFSGPEPPDGGCDDCGGGCTGEGCGCIDCDPGDDPCDDLVTLAICPPGNQGPCVETAHSKLRLVDSNCINDCQDSLIDLDCTSCILGFLPDMCEECCPDDPPPPPPSVGRPPTIVTDFGGGGGGGSGGLVTRYVCEGDHTGNCNGISVDPDDLDADGKLKTTGQQTYETNSACSSSPECCPFQDFTFWKCDLQSNCECVPEVFQSCQGISPGPGYFTSKQGCENSSSNGCCKDDVASAAQTFVSEYPFDINGNPVGGVVANYCPGDNVILRPTNPETIATLSNEFDISFEVINSSEDDINFNTSNGDIFISSAALADAANIGIKITIERSCCETPTPAIIDILVASLVNALPPTARQCAEAAQAQGVDLDG